MGYQRINIHLKSGRILRGVVVLNAELCQVPEIFDPAEVEDVQLDQ